MILDIIPTSPRYHVAERTLSDVERAFALLDSLAVALLPFAEIVAMDRPGEVAAMYTHVETRRCHQAKKALDDLARAFPPPS